MSNTPPILNYSKPPRGSAVAVGLRIIGAVVCACTTLIGLAILLVGLGGIRTATFAEMPAIDRPRVLGQAAVIVAIGLVVAGFSVRWFLDAVRAARRAGSEVAPEMAESPGAADKSGR
jgi:hypothetical protein